MKTMITKTIYLIRHGEIEKTKEKSFVGSIDLSLSHRGRQQAEALGQVLKQTRLEAIFSSKLQRSIHTAQILQSFCQPSPPLVAMEAFNEIHMGEWEGKTFQEVQSLYPKSFAERGKDPVHFRPPAGESFHDCHQRAMKGFQQILETDYKHILIVGHAGLNRLILCSLLNIQLDHLFTLQQDYSCLNEIRFQDHRFRLVKMNCRC